MYITCLDLEGVLVPEIWIAFSEASGIPELRRTTRDEPDYDKLMRWRLGILKEHGLGLKEIQDVIATIDPLPGAKEFLDELRSITQAVILSSAGRHCCATSWWSPPTGKSRTFACAAKRRSSPLYAPSNPSALRLSPRATASMTSP